MKLLHGTPVPTTCCLEYLDHYFISMACFNRWKPWLSVEKPNWISLWKQWRCRHNRSRFPNAEKTGPKKKTGNSALASSHYYPEVLPFGIGNSFKWLHRKVNILVLYSKGTNRKANFFTKYLANIFDFAVIFRLMQSENKTTYELIIIQWALRINNKLSDQPSKLRCWLAIMEPWL